MRDRTRAAPARAYVLIIRGRRHLRVALEILIYFFTESTLCDDYPLGFNSMARSLSSRTGECGLAIHENRAYAIASNTVLQDTRARPRLLRSS